MLTSFLHIVNTAQQQRRMRDIAALVACAVWVVLSKLQDTTERNVLVGCEMLSIFFIGTQSARRRVG